MFPSKFKDVRLMFSSGVAEVPEHQESAGPANAGFIAGSLLSCHAHFVRP
ncbi:MAG: hypothetical protein ACOCRN_05865 [Spirochaetia bacterium]